MTILERLEKEKEFIRKTSIILDRLLNWQLEWVSTQQKPAKEVVEQEWTNFYELLEKGKKDGIADGYFFYSQGRTLINAFTFFDDVVPELKLLRRDND